MIISQATSSPALYIVLVSCGAPLRVVPFFQHNASLIQTSLVFSSDKRARILLVLIVDKGRELRPLNYDTRAPCKPLSACKQCK